MNCNHATARRVVRQRRPNHKGSRLGFDGLAGPRPVRTKPLKGRPAGWNAKVAQARKAKRLMALQARADRRGLKRQYWPERPAGVDPPAEA